MFALFAGFFYFTRNVAIFLLSCSGQYFFHISLGDDLVISSETEGIMQLISKICARVFRDVTFSGQHHHLHLFQSSYDIFTGITLTKFFLKYPVDDQCRKTCDEVCRDSVFPAKIYWPSPKLTFHYPEAFLNLPTLLVDTNDC